MIASFTAEENETSFKCGEVYYSATLNYSVNCYLCSEKLPFNEFQHHYESFHLRPNQDCAEKDFDQRAADATMEQLIKKEEYDTDSLDEVDEIPIEFLEVRLPKLNSQRASKFIPEHVTMDYEYIAVNSAFDPTIDSKENVTEFQIAEKSVPHGIMIDLSVEVRQSKEAQLPSTIQLQDQKDNNISPMQIQGSLSSTSDANNPKNDNTKNNKNFSDVKYSCKYCQRTYKLRRNLEQHLRIVHEQKNSQSSKASKTNADEKTNAVSKAKPSSCACSVCGKLLNCLGSLSTHMKRHTGAKSHKCPDCNKLFYTVHEMKQHMLRHSDMLAEICEVCGSGFRSSGKLKSHMRRHTGERPAKCDICGKCFYSIHDLNVHHVTHTSERPFACDECSSTFRSKKALRVHKKLHVVERPHQCELCGKAFLKESGVESHMRQVHMKVF